MIWSTDKSQEKVKRVQKNVSWVEKVEVLQGQSDGIDVDIVSQHEDGGNTEWEKIHDSSDTETWPMNGHIKRVGVKPLET